MNIKIALKIEHKINTVDCARDKMAQYHCAFVAHNIGTTKKDDGISFANYYMCLRNHRIRGFRLDRRALISYDNIG